jgi:Dihydrodipicolinate synthetase family
MPSPWSHERAYWRRQPGPPSLVPLAQAAPGATGQAAERTQLLSGSLTALATPFQNDRIAEKAFAHFVNWQIEQGAQGLVVCSATGEGATLTLQERSLVIQIAVETTAGRIPIVAATGVNWGAARIDETAGCGKLHRNRRFGNDDDRRRA